MWGPKRKPKLSLPSGASQGGPNSPTLGMRSRSAACNMQLSIPKNKSEAARRPKFVLSGNPSIAISLSCLARRRTRRLSAPTAIAKYSGCPSKNSKSTFANFIGLHCLCGFVSACHASIRVPTGRVANIDCDLNRQFIGTAGFCEKLLRSAAGLNALLGERCDPHNGRNGGLNHNIETLVEANRPSRPDAVNQRPDFFRIPGLQTNEGVRARYVLCKGTEIQVFSTASGRKSKLSVIDPRQINKECVFQTVGPHQGHATARDSSDRLK
jgi:hypothetical protein